MDVVKRWWLRLAAATAATVGLVLLPTAAWAHSRPGVVAIGDELARRRPRVGGGLGLVGGCCCLFVVLVVVLVVVLISRRRRRPPAPPPQYPR
jgi:uncharacterized membrane-anchored protein